MSQRPVQTTVVIPVWDAYVTRFLTDALTSIRDQEMTAQIIVVDNASGAAVTGLPDVTVLRSPERLSLGRARNFGLSRVTTPYVLFWDADDLMPPGTLAALEEAIAVDRRLVAFGQAIVENGGQRYRWPRRWIGSLLRRPRLFVLVHSAWSTYPATGATIMRTEVVRSAGGYADTDSGQDWCLGVSLAFRGQLGWSERPGRIYRVHDESVSHRHGSLQDHLHRAHTVRAWIRNDPDAPAWVQRALPLIHVGQYAAVAGHLLAAGLRRRRGDPRWIG
jgi:glycosyltransferase involved in cell wall biosynthesis